MRVDPIPGTIEDVAFRGDEDVAFRGDEERHCAAPDCGAVLVRAWHPDGSREPPGKFARRRFCGRLCYARSRQAGASQARRSARLEARLAREWLRSEAEAARLLPRSAQAAHVEELLRAHGLHEVLAPTQFGSVRLLAALCWKYRGLAAAAEFIGGIARTVPGGPLGPTGGAG